MTVVQPESGEDATNAITPHACPGQNIHAKSEIIHSDSRCFEISQEYEETSLNAARLQEQ